MRADIRTFVRRFCLWPTVVLVGMCAVTVPARWTRAQEPPPGQFDYAPHSMDELQQLVAPIALYPDALLAQALTASTYPDDVVAAARWVDAGNDPQAAGSQPWDSSVQGLAHYPTVLHYMAGNGDWMNDLGDAFLNQQADVMSAVQNLRGEALAAGTLGNTQQQTVINQDGYIQIIPTDPQYIYAPTYDPQVVYAPPQYVVGQAYPSYITYGPRVEVGDWLDFDLDWHDRAVYSGRWGRDRPWWHDRDRREFHYLNDRPGVYRPGQFRDVQGRPIEAQANHWARDDRRPPPRRVARPEARPPIERPDRGYQQRTPPANNRPAETPRGTDVSRQSERGRTSRDHAAQPEQRPAAQPTPRSPEPAPRAPAPAPRAPQPAPRAVQPTPQGPEPTPRAPAPAPRTPNPAPQPPQPAPRAPEPTPRAPEPAPRAPAPAPHAAEPAPRAPAPTPRAAAPTPRAPDQPRPAPRQPTPAPEARPSAPTHGGAMGGYQSGAAASQSAARGSASRGGKH
jgi:hypothetical protein